MEVGMDLVAGFRERNDSASWLRTVYGLGQDILSPEYWVGRLLTDVDWKSASQDGFCIAFRRAWAMT